MNGELQKSKKLPVCTPAHPEEFDCKLLGHRRPSDHMLLTFQGKAVLVCSVLVCALVHIRNPNMNRTRHARAITHFESTWEKAVTLQLSVHQHLLLPSTCSTFTSNAPLVRTDVVMNPEERWLGLSVQVTCHHTLSRSKACYVSLVNFIPLTDELTAE